MAKTTVTGFDIGFSNSALPLPYALARLTCGHVARVETKPTLYACTACGRETTSCQHASCSCGSTKAGFRFVHIANPHLPEDRLTQIGDVIECESCAAEAKQLEWLRDLPRETVQHARYKRMFGHGVYHFYRRDKTSPTGVFLIGSVAATPAVEALLAEKRISPLSPTEAR